MILESKEPERSDCTATYQSVRLTVVALLIVVFSFIITHSINGACTLQYKASWGLRPLSRLNFPSGYNANWKWAWLFVIDTSLSLSLSLSLSVCVFNGHPFSRWTWVSRHLLKQRMMELWWWQLDYWSSCKAPVKSSPCMHQQTTSSFFTGRMPFLSPNQQRQALKGKYHIPYRLAYPKLTWGLPTLSLTTNSSWLPWSIGLPCLSSALWCQYPNDTSH